MKGGPPPRPAASRPERIAAALARLAPKLPRFEREAVVDHASVSPGLAKAMPDTAAWLALVAFARHNFTDYDDLLADGYDVESARHFVLDAINDALAAWGVARRLSATDAAENG